MVEKDGILYIWWNISDSQFAYYCSKYEYLGSGYYNDEDISIMALKFRVKGE